MSRLSTVAACALILLGSVAAHAQDPAPEPLPVPRMTPFVVDARTTLARLKQDLTVASAFGVDATELPSRGLGFVIGAHVYPIRSKKFALGIGGEMLRVRGSNTIEFEPEDEDEEPIEGPTLKTRWNQLSPQVSLNFGARDGWSYVTVGLGRASFAMERREPDETPSPMPDEEEAEKVRVLNYGGGARWFMKKHLAFTLDLRFYSINAQEATASRIATPKMRVMVFSGGVSIR